MPWRLFEETVIQAQVLLRGNMDTSFLKDSFFGLSAETFLSEKAPGTHEIMVNLSKYNSSSTIGEQPTYLTYRTFYTLVI